MASDINTIKDKQKTTCFSDGIGYKKIHIKDFETKIGERPEKVGNRWLQFAATISVALCAMTIGTTYSWTSPALPHLKSNISEIPITEIEGSWIATLLDVGGFLGNILFLLLSNFLGRKNSILMLAIPYMISWLMIIFAKDILLLYASRLISGIAGDFAICLVPLYVGEIADKEIRGILLIMLRIFWNSGHMLVKTAAVFFSYETLNMVMFSVPFIFFGTFIFMPESPYYLLIKNKRNRALKTLMKLKGVKEADIVINDLERMQNSVKENQENKKWMFGELFCIRGNRKSLLIVLTAWTTKFLSGTSSIASFTQEIFEETETSIAPKISTMIIAIIGVIMALLATLLIERVGRRMAFLFSGLFCSLGLSMVGLFFFLKIVLMVNVASINWLPLAGLIIYEVAYTLGLAYIPTILNGEMFALNVKIPAVSTIFFGMSLVQIGVKVSFQWVNDLAGIYTTFWMYAICSLVGSIIFFSIAPETKGKTLEEIQGSLHAKSRN